MQEDTETFLENEFYKAENKDYNSMMQRISYCKIRLSEIEKLMCRIYEDMIIEKISEERYESMNKGYEQEQKALSEEIKTLEKGLETHRKTRSNGRKFTELMDRYENFDSLTNEMIEELVERILIHERKIKWNIESPQEIEIYFKFIGNYVPGKERKAAV